MIQSMNRLSAIAVSVMLSTQLILPAFAISYADTTGSWAQQAIENLSQRGILTGYPNGQFKPQGRISRAEFAAMLVKAENLGNQSSDKSLFVDVPPTFWAYAPIQIVANNGLVSGYPGGYFKPAQDITRAEAMSILVNAGHIPLPSQAEAAQVLRNYQDAYLVPQWAQRSVAAAIHSGIFSNFPNPQVIQPNQPATREEVAALVDHLENLQATTGRPGPDVSTTREGSSETTSASQQGNLIRGHIAVVPADSIITGLVTQPISSDRSQVGDPVSLTLDKPVISASGEIAIPQNSQIIGRITQINPAGPAERNAGVAMDFNQVITPDGKTFNISAEVNADNGILKGGTTKGRVGRVAGRTLGGAVVGGGAGALIGHVIGKNKTNEGLLWGSIIGSGLGATSAVVGRGKEVVVQPGEALELKLRQPLSVTVP